MGVTGLTTNFIAQKRLTWYNGWMDFQRLNDRTSWEPTLCEVVVLSSRTWIQPVYGQNRKVWEARGKGGSDPLIITPNKPSQNIFFMFPQPLSLLIVKSWILRKRLSPEDKAPVPWNKKLKLIPSYFEPLMLPLNHCKSGGEVT